MDRRKVLWLLGNCSLAGSPLLFAACEQLSGSAPTSPSSPNSRYLFSGSAREDMPVIEAIRMAGFNPQTRFYGGMGHLITTVSGDTRPWRIDVDGLWFGLDAATKIMRKGQSWGSFQG